MDLDGLSISAATSEDAGSRTDAPEPHLGGEIEAGSNEDGPSAPDDAQAKICRPGFTGIDCTTPCPAGKAGAACDFERVLGLDIPVRAEWNVPADVPYSEDRTASVGLFSRIAYRLVLDSNEVWVELDAFTNDAKLLGVPVDWSFDQPIANAIVHSFAPTQPHVLVPTSGNVELWSSCYGEGADGVFDADDHEGGDTDCYGSMQIHVAGKPVLSFNHWSQGGTKDLDLGIGPSPGNHLDWTFAENAATFTKRRLEVYVR